MNENQAQKVVGRWNHGFVLCSAQTGDRVTDVFKVYIHAIDNDEIENDEYIMYSIENAD